MRLRSIGQIGLQKEVESTGQIWLHQKRKRTGQIWLQFSFLWKENCWSRSVKPSRAVLIRTAFSFSNLSFHKQKRHTPKGVCLFVIRVQFRYFSVAQVPARFVCIFLPDWEKNYCSPPSSRRRQLSTGQLHLYLQILGRYLQKKKNPNGFFFF